MRQRVGGAPVRRASALSISCCRKKIERGSQNDDRTELADLGPGRRNGRAQDVGTELQLQRDRQPAAKLEPNGFLGVRLAGNRRTRHEQGKRAQERLDRRQPDHQRRACLYPRGKP